ncbi:MAG: hypothetical protein Q9201_005895, partial [Fulgogasparrea decipioides]
MLPTPSTSHVDTDRIYEPAEDSFLFLDTLSSAAQISFFKARFGLGRDHDSQNSSPLIVEIGIGSGVILAFVTAHVKTLFGRSDILSLGVDINHYACRASAQTVISACQDTSGADLFLTSLEGDLASALRPGSVDVLIFNPPYVPTSEVPQLVNTATSPAKEDDLNEGMEKALDKNSQMLSLSYAGGIDGMEVTNRLLDQLPSVLNAERGVAYILLCKQNKPAAVAERIQRWGAEWKADVVGWSGKQGGWEKLQVLRISRTRR